MEILYTKVKWIIETRNIINTVPIPKDIIKCGIEHPKEEI